MNTNDEMKRLGDEVAALRNEVAQLRGRGGNQAVVQRQYHAPATVPDAEVRKLEELIELAIRDPDQGLAPENKQYARPVLEVIASTTGLRFGDAPDLPPVKQIDRNQLAPLRPAAIDESKLNWDANLNQTPNQK